MSQQPPQMQAVNISYNFGQLTAPPGVGHCKTCKFWRSQTGLIPCYDLQGQAVPKQGMIKAGLPIPLNAKTLFLAMCVYLPSWIPRTHDAFCGCHEKADEAEIRSREIEILEKGGL